MTVMVTVFGVHDDLAANNDSVFIPNDTLVNIEVLPNDEDPNGYDMVMTSATNGTSGTTEVYSDGKITYTSHPTFSGIDTFMYTISDETNITATTTVTIYVNMTDDPPEMQPDIYFTPHDTLIMIPMLANDVDPNDNNTLYVKSYSSASNGAVVMINDTMVSYKPDTGFQRLDNFA